MDAIYTFGDYGEDSRPRLEFPKRTGRRTTYGQWLEYQYGLHHDEGLPPAGGSRPMAAVWVNHGRWLWQCPGCLTAVQVSETGGVVDLCCCPACFGQAFVQPVFPAERAEIEAELMRQPGYRWNAPFRNWELGWSLAYLRERTAAAQAKLDAGATYVRSASIGTPRTWSVGEVLTASNMNNFIREIQKDLIGTNGEIELLHGVRPGSFTTAQLAALAGVPNGTLFHDSTLDRIVYSASTGIAQTSQNADESSLFDAVGFVTITHTLGIEPVFFALEVERVQNSTWEGHVLGSKVRIMLGGAVNANSFTSLAIWGITATQYYAHLQNKI